MNNTDMNLSITEMMELILTGANGSELAVEGVMLNAIDHIKKLEEQNEKMLVAFRVLLQDMDNVDRVCDRAGVHPFTGMRSVIQSFVNEGEKK
jgi:hypothetical protein